MTGFDRHRFADEHEPDWRELERLLERIDDGGLGSLGIEDARRLGELYRGVSSDLIRARTELMSPLVVDYLNGLVARAYVAVYGRRRASYVARVARFFANTYPRIVRREWRAIALSTCVFLFGGAFGAAVVIGDPAAASIVVPAEHQRHTPTERVAREEAHDSAAELNLAAAFTSFLFTNNLRVTFLVFALGMTAGLGTLALLFLNGVPLGALAAQYHLAGEGLFFWAWILPHGIPELTSIFIAGGAGLLLARGMLLPGGRGRRDALAHEARSAVRLVLGSMPILVVAGFIEGTLSQIHEPTIAYETKLFAAFLIAAGLLSFLLAAGRAQRALPSSSLALWRRSTKA